ncbi:hypothetical protein GCM10022408_20900 [Hymenobacter fastidiosus]|uniref:histidine kinase n=1 Tax=Hymenobacter fastidiosus TaxID=486264 RepID=A0ABP7S9Q9_9BACT
MLELRRRAEARRLLVTQAVSDTSPQDVQRLVQELQVHQLELEMQYEELLRAQAETEAVRAQYVDLYDFAPVGYFTLDAHGLIGQLNLSGATLLGAVRQRLIGHRFPLFIAPAGREEFAGFLARVLAAGSRQTCELEMLREDGTSFFAQLEGLAVAPPGAEQPQCRLAVIDTTARRETRQALAASEARFRQLFEQSADASLLVHHNVVVACNAAALGLLGARQKTQLVGHSPWARASPHHPDGRPSPGYFAQAVAVAQHRGSWRGEFTLYRLSGELCWVEAVLTPITVSGQLLLHMTWRDVTAQHEAAEELSYQNLLMQRMLETMPVVLARLEPDGRYVAAGGQGLRNLGLTNDSLIGRNVLDTFPAARTPVGRLLAGERVEFDTAVEYAGRQIYFHGYGFFDEQRRQATLLVIDVTEVEEQKQQLQTEKEVIESLLNNSVDGIMAFNQQGRFLAWNRVLEQRTGHRAADVLGRDVFAVFPEWQAKAEGEAIGRVLQGQRVTRYNLPFHPQPGHYESYLVPLLGPGNEVNGGLILIRDVTERVALAEESTRLKLRQQQEVLSAILTTQEEERKRIAEALHNGVGQLLYAAKLNLENRSAAVSPFRTTAISLLNDAIRATRTISFELTPGILEDFGLKIALEELCKRIPKQNLRFHLNLAGLEKPRPRLIEIATYRVVQELLNNIIKHAQASEVFIHVVHEGPDLHISVEDNGVGISPAHLEAPLTGIGLAGIRNRIDLLGGELKVESRLGRGTIISIELRIKN